MQDRLDRAVLGGHFRECEILSMRSRQWNRFMSELVRSDDEMILLFTPPFQQTPRDPGYIKGYPRGVRENGGQYTHAALWAIWAFAQLGQSDRAS